MSARLDGFTGATREALVLASAQGRLTPAQLDAAGIEPSALDPALDGQVIELAHGTVRFTHPLLASVLYQGLSAGERQRAHRRLARLAEDPVARARHLALSTDVSGPRARSRTRGGGSGRRQPRRSDRRGRARRARRPVDAIREPRGLDRRAASAVRAHLAAGEVERGRAAGGRARRASSGRRRSRRCAVSPG